MECTIHWLPASGMAFVAETGSGHLLTMDGAPDGGGRNLAPRPMETLLAGAGACTAYDVVLILQRLHWWIQPGVRTPGFFLGPLVDGRRL